MLSARPFWALFTICIILLVELLVARPVAEWKLTDEIINLNITYKKANKFISKSSAPSEVKSFYKRASKKTPDPRGNPDGYVRKEDLQGLGLRNKWDLLYFLDKWRAVLLAAVLIAFGFLVGFLIASVAFRHLVDFGNRLSDMSSMDKIAAFLGLLVGLLLSGILLPTVMALMGLGHSPIFITVAGIIVTYLCVVGLMSMKEELKYYFPGLSGMSGDKDKAFQKPKILDTNVIIDGRIADICRAGFVEGQVYVPSFVLEELQHIADSSDSLRRARGRRGLDILNQMRKELDLVIKQGNAVDAENPEEVDARLVKMAKEIDGCIVTNDFNLNKVAELQGVTVLNINELANALKPVVLPGEEMIVTVIKEGKEINQGIAYLDDGTMVVVEGARKHIGETLDVIVTSVLQTVAGKMIFANLKTAQEQEDELIDRNVRNYSGFRPRKKTR